MQNYYPDLVWKVDLTLLVILVILIFFIIIYLVIGDFLLSRRKRRLMNIKRNIYDLFISKKNKNVRPAGSEKFTPKEFLDVATNRSRWAVFFNEEEQEYFKSFFVNQKNILKIERTARRGRNKWHRIEAMLALGLSGASSALPIFEKGLFDKDLDISYFSLLSLGQIKTGLSARILLAFLKKDALMRRKTASVLENFPLFAVDEIIKLADDLDPGVRFWVTKILSRFKPVKYTEKIKALSRDKSAQVRAAACECFGNIGGKKAEEVLIPCLKDESWLVRVQAAQGLANATGGNCAKYIAELLSDNSLNVVEAAKEILIQNIDASLPYLKKILDGQDELSRKMAVEVLTTAGVVLKGFKEALTKEGSD